MGLGAPSIYNKKISVDQMAVDVRRTTTGPNARLSQMVMDKLSNIHLEMCAEIEAIENFSRDIDHTL